MRNNLGSAAYYRGDYGDALGQYQTAYQALAGAARKPWFQSVEQMTLLNLATVFQRLGRHRAALDIYRKLVAEPGGLSPSEAAQFKTNLAVLYRRLGDPWKALAMNEEALKESAKEVQNDRRLSVYINLGILRAVDLNDVKGAEAEFARALALAKASGAARAAMQAHLYLAETHFREGEIARAKADWELALQASRKLGTVEEEWKSLHGLARVAAREGRLDEAVRLAGDAVSIVESVRGRIQGATLKSEYLFDKRDLYDDWISWRPGAPPDELWTLIERAKGRVLAEQMARSASSGGDDDLKVAELRREIGKLHRQRASSPSDALQIQIARVESEYDLLDRKLHPSVEAWRAGREDLKSVQQRLKVGEAVLNYWVGMERSVVVWITSTASGSASLDVRRPQIDRAVRDWLDHIEAGKSPGGEISRALLPELPVWHDQAIRRIWIVPDGALSTLPFELLEIPGSGRLNGGGLRNRVSAVGAPAAPTSGARGAKALAVEPRFDRVCRSGEFRRGAATWRRAIRAVAEVQGRGRGGGSSSGHLSTVVRGGVNDAREPVEISAERFDPASCDARRGGSGGWRQQPADSLQRVPVCGRGGDAAAAKHVAGHAVGVRDRARSAARGRGRAEPGTGVSCGGRAHNDCHAMEGERHRRGAVYGAAISGNGSRSQPGCGIAGRQTGVPALWRHSGRAASLGGVCGARGSRQSGEPAGLAGVSTGCCGCGDRGGCRDS